MIHHDEDYQTATGFGSEASPPTGGEVSQYKWKIGDVFTNGKYEWRVDSICGDKAVLRLCGHSFGTTRHLTVREWHSGGNWTLKQGSSESGSPQEEPK